MRLEDVVARWCLYLKASVDIGQVAYDSDLFTLNGIEVHRDLGGIADYRVLLKEHSPFEKNPMLDHHIHEMGLR